MLTVSDSHCSVLCWGLAIGLTEKWDMTRGKEGSQLGFHSTCPGGRDGYGAWSLSVSFVLAGGTKSPLFLILLTWKHWD